MVPEKSAPSGGTLIWGNSQILETLNPLVSHDRIPLIHKRMLFDTLVVWGGKTGMEIVPWLATKIISSSIVGGLIITLLTGLILNTPHMLVGATHYGYPLPWLIRLVLAPQYFPWRVNIAYLIANIIVWSVIVGIIIFVVKRSKK